MNLQTSMMFPSWDWTPEIKGEIRRVLPDRNEDHAERLAAAEMAGEYSVIDDELAGMLLDILASSEEPEDIRVKAAISFGPALEHADLGFDDEDEIVISEDLFHRIQEAMHKVYLDPATPKELRRRVVEGSVRAPLDWHKEAIRKAYAESDPEWKQTAVFAMGYVPGFNAEILESLKSSDPEVHYQAVVAAGNNEVDAAAPHILQLAKSKKIEKELRIVAIEALGSIGPEGSLEVLTDLLDSPDEDIADAASQALAMAGANDEPFDEDEEADEDGEDKES